MSIARFQWQQPAKYVGLDQYAPKEIEDFAFSLIQRLEINTRSLVDEIRAQCVVDEAILSIQAGGEDAGSTNVLAVTSDVDGAMLESMLWND